MDKFYFQHRNIGLNPNTTKYYFSTIEELINQVELLKKIESETSHFKWSISKSNRDNQYALMSEFLNEKSAVTDISSKSIDGWVCGYIFTDETTNDIHEILPTWEAG